MAPHLPEHAEPVQAVISEGSPNGSLYQGDRSTPSSQCAENFCVWQSVLSVLLVRCLSYRSQGFKKISQNRSSSRTLVVLAYYRTCLVLQTGMKTAVLQDFK